MHAENKKYGPNFTIAEVVHQSWWSLLDENIMDLYKINYYSAIKKKWNLAIHSSMDGTRGQ